MSASPPTASCSVSRWCSEQRASGYDRAPVTSPRTILHADMDAFYAAIEQRDRPELRGRPVIVGGDQPRQVVATASYEARKFGVHSAMPGVQARRLCPQGIFVPPRMDVYVAASQQVRAVFERRYSSAAMARAYLREYRRRLGDRRPPGDSPLRKAA